MPDSGCAAFTVRAEGDHVQYMKVVAFIAFGRSHSIRESGRVHFLRQVALRSISVRRNTFTFRVVRRHISKCYLCARRGQRARPRMLFAVSFSGPEQYLYISVSFFSGFATTHYQYCCIRVPAGSKRHKKNSLSEQSLCDTKSSRGDSEKDRAPSTTPYRARAESRTANECIRSYSKQNKSTPGRPVASSRVPECNFKTSC